MMRAGRRGGARLILPLASAVLFSACGADSTAPVADEDLQALEADQVLIGVEHNVTGDGIRRAFLRADTAYMYDEAGLVELRTVHLTLYDEIGRETADLTAQRGTLQTGSQQMTATGSVVLVTTDGTRRLESDELHYDPRYDRIWSDVAVVLQRDGTRIRGDGLTADGRLENIEIRNPTGQFEDIEFEF